MTKREKILALLLVLIVVGAVVCYLFRLKGIEINAKDGIGLLVAIGTVGMTLMLVYLEVFKSWIKKPEIKIEFRNEAPFCRDTPTSVENEVGHFIRLRIRNTGGSVAKNLRGKLVEVIDKDGKIYKDFDPLFLHWVSIPVIRQNRIDPRAKWLDPIDLNVKEWEYLGVFYTLGTLKKKEDSNGNSLGKKEKGLIHIRTKEEDRGCRMEFKISEGLKAFKITIYGENIEPVTETYELAWDGKKYNNIEMYKAGRKEKLAMVKPKKESE